MHLSKHQNWLLTLFQFLKIKLCLFQLLFNLAESLPNMTKCSIPLIHIWICHVWICVTRTELLKILTRDWGHNTLKILGIIIIESLDHTLLSNHYYLFPLISWYCPCNQFWKLWSYVLYVRMWNVYECSMPKNFVVHTFRITYQLSSLEFLYREKWDVNVLQLGQWMRIMCKLKYTLLPRPMPSLNYHDMRCNACSF